MSLGCKINKIHTVIICMLAVFISFMCITLNVRADYKEYWIHDAKFDIEFNENGDAVVTETWNIEFHGDFTRFYKEFNTKDVDIIEKYNSLDVKNIKINGVDCEKAFNDRDREDYTYYLKPTDKGIQLEFYYGAHNEYVEYQVTYTLKGVIKEVINGSAIFCYRLIGANFSKNVSDIEINLSGTGLDRNNLDIRHLTDEENYEIENTDNGYRLTNSRGYKEKTVLKLNVALDKNSFTGLKQVNAKDLKNNLQEKRIDKLLSWLRENFILLLPFGILMISVIYWISSVLKVIYNLFRWAFENLRVLSPKNAKAIDKARCNPRYPDECFDYFKQLNFNILSFHYKNRKLSAKKKLVIYLVGLKVQNVIRVEKSNNIVIMGDYNRKLCGIEYKVFEEICRIVGTEDRKNGTYILNTKSLKKIIQGKSLASRNKLKEIEKCLNTLLNYHDKEIETDKTFKKRVEFIHYYIRWMKLSCNSSTFGALKNGLTLKNAIIWMYTEQVKTVKSMSEFRRAKMSNENAVRFKDDDDDLMDIDLKDLFDAVDKYFQKLDLVFEEHISSSGSGCSSCSSCSSCGGCGGGGAD